MAAGVLAGAFAAAAAAIRFTDESYFTPEGVVEASYSHIFEIAVGGGTAPYTYTVLSGALPPGLSLNSSTGAVTGKPTVAGIYSFWLEGADSCPSNPACANPSPPPDFFPQAKTQREFTINVIPRLLVTNQFPGSATVGTPYSFQVTAVMKSGPEGTSPPSSPVTWSLQGGQLPPGLTLGANGVLSGTPTTVGSNTFLVLAVLDPKRSDTKQLKIDVRAALALTAPKLPRGAEVGVRFSATLGATGGTGPGTHTWTLSGGKLPPGLTLGANGAIAGMPTAAGSYAFTATVSDTEGRATTQPVRINVASRLAIVTLRLRAGKVARPFKAKLATIGGVLPKKWKITGGKLPRGVRLNTALGVLLGTPRKEGTYRFTVEVVDALGVASTKTLTLVVNA